MMAAALLLIAATATVRTAGDGSHASRIDRLETGAGG
jgi:hypothetical protein